MTARIRIIGVFWTLCAIVLIGALIAGLAQVLGDTSAERAYSWVMALFFLGGSFAWLTYYFQDSLRRFFGRDDKMTP